MDKMGSIMHLKIMKIKSNFNKSTKRMLKMILKIKNLKSFNYIKSQNNNRKFKKMNSKNFIITNKFVKMFKMYKI